MKSVRTLLDNVDTKLEENVANKLEAPLTKQELEKADKAMNKGKSPGEDGIVIEFYQNFWNTISADFTELIQEMFITDSLATSQKRGLITQGEREEIKNWRPITLNLDYRIIAKTLAERLKNTLQQIIHSDQKGFVEVGKIMESLQINTGHNKLA
jgi:hypothetical protein